MPESSETILCEAYGPGGAAMLVQCRTVDAGCTVARVRAVLHEHGGYLGAPGSVGYLFNPVGRLRFAAGTDAHRLLRVAVEAGAEEVVTATGEVLTDPIELDTVRSALQAAGLTPVSAGLTRRAALKVPLPQPVAVDVVHLISALKQLNEVENVYTNGEIPDEVLAGV